MALRSKEAVNQKGERAWAKGGSPDHGISSRAIAALSELSEGDKGKAKSLCGKILPACKGLSDGIQRAALLCCASDFSFDSLAKLSETPAKRVSAVEQRRQILRDAGVSEELIMKAIPERKPKTE